MKFQISSMGKSGLCMAVTASLLSLASPWNLEGQQTRSPAFTKDVAPIIYRHCAPCHRPDGAGPFPLLSYEDVKKRARLVRIVAERRLMPPWKPEPGHGEFRGARYLKDTEIRTIQRWVAGGAIEGQAKDLPPAPVMATGWQLGEPDVILQMLKVYNVPAGGPEFYRCFVIPTGLQADQYLLAAETRPDSRQVVHHAILVQDVHGAARRMETEPGGGYPCMGGFGFQTTGYLGFWTAGVIPNTMPEGVATPLKKGSDVVLQIHFRPSGKPQQERLRLGLYFAKRPPRRIPSDIAAMTYDIDIPAGARDHRVKAFTYVPNDVIILSVFPHAHYLAKGVRASGVLPDGTVRTLLWIKEWDFNWQEEYWYAKPIELPQGTRLDVEFTYDNSAGNPRNARQTPERVIWGETTTDEMAEVHFRAVTQSQEGKIESPR